jgi:hypothetical protein
VTTLNKFLSRKYILSLLSLLISTVLLIFHYIDGAVFEHIVIATVAVYIAGNAYQNVNTEPTS